MYPSPFFDFVYACNIHFDAFRIGNKTKIFKFFLINIFRAARITHTGVNGLKFLLYARAPLVNGEKSKCRLINNAKIIKTHKLKIGGL